MLIETRADYHQLISDIASIECEKHKTELIRSLCKDDLFFLLVYGLNRIDADKDWLFERCREVQEKPNNMIDLWSREHYKSTIITFALTIQNILNDPNITVGIFSHTRPIAKAFLRQIKREFELNTHLKNLFPDVLYENPQKESIKWSEDDGIIVKRSSNSKEATVEAWGVVDGQPTGKHFSLLVYDDIVTKESVTTPEMIEKTTDSLALSYNLGAHGGNRRFIGTRYHFNDTYKTIIERGTAEPRIHKATIDGSPTGDPVFLTEEQLKNKRRDMGPYVFSCQMLQNPIADGSQGFKREWLRYFDGEPPKNCVWYLVVDAASSKKKGSDYTSMWAIGLCDDDNYYVIPEVRDRLNLTERAARVIALHKKYKPIEVRYERYGVASDIEYIFTVMDQEQYRFDIIEVAGPIAKNDRIVRLVPSFEQGRMYLPKERYVTNYEGRAYDLVNDFIEQEYVAFPVPLHDDMLDSLSRICEVEGTSIRGNKKIPLKLAWPKKKVIYKAPQRQIPTGIGAWMT
jgi:phage terminase large subunit-like protein